MQRSVGTALEQQKSPDQWPSAINVDHFYVNSDDKSREVLSIALLVSEMQSSKHNAHEKHKDSIFGKS